MVVFREGEAGDWAFLVRSGRFEVFKDLSGDRRLIGVAETGGLFGELALIDRGRRMASARCVEAGELLLVDRPRFEVKLSSLNPAQRKLFSELLRFIRETSPCVPEKNDHDWSPSPERIAQVKSLLGMIEREGLYRTSDAFINGLTRTLGNYVKRRLPKDRIIDVTPQGSASRTGSA